MSRTAEGLHVFVGRYELQHRAFARAHSQVATSANGEQGPAAIRRDLRNLRTHAELELDDFHPPVTPPVNAGEYPVARPAASTASPASGRSATRTWHRATSFHHDAP